MNQLPVIDILQKQFGKIIRDVDQKSTSRVTIVIDPSAIVTVSNYLFRDLHFRFIIASALETERGIEIFYHFSEDITGLIVNVNVILNKEKPEIESLTFLFEAANWIEREMHEIIGVYFRNHPNLEKLISEGNWAEGVYPYRKS